VIEKLRGLRLSRAAELVEAAIEETLAYYAFPEEHWRQIRTNNPLERILREIRRRTPVVWAHSLTVNPRSTSPLPLRHIAGTAWAAYEKAIGHARLRLLSSDQWDGCRADTHRACRISHRPARAR
jgi:hypothetical protein